MKFGYRSFALVALLGTVFLLSPCHAVERTHNVASSSASGAAAPEFTLSHEYLQERWYVGKASVLSGDTGEESPANDINSSPNESPARNKQSLHEAWDGGGKLQLRLRLEMEYGVGLHQGGRDRSEDNIAVGSIELEFGGKGGMASWGVYVSPIWSYVEGGEDTLWGGGLGARYRIFWGEPFWKEGKGWSFGKYKGFYTEASLGFTFLPSGRKVHDAKADLLLGIALGYQHRSGLYVALKYTYLREYYRVNEFFTSDDIHASYISGVFGYSFRVWQQEK